MLSVLIAVFGSAHAKCLNNTVYSCRAPCFCEPTWNETEVQSIDNITYSEKYGLKLHLFLPPSSDKRSLRPAVVAIHGGHFASGSRAEAGLVDWCQRFAARGYVAASIDYRLLWSKLGHPGDIVQAAWDARAAIRYLQKNSSLRVDKDRIAAFGASAGGMTVVYLVAVGGGDGDSGNPGYSSSIRAGVSLSGALYTPPPNMTNISAAEAPYLDFHGCADPLVPYDCDDGCTCEGKRNCKSCWGTAMDTHRNLSSSGAVAELYSFPGAGHVPYDALAAPAAAEAMVGFLAQHLDLSHAECPTRDDGA